MLSPRNPDDAEYFRILNALAHSGLGDIPQHLITPAQIEAVLSGEDVTPTPEQRAASLRVGGEVRMAPVKKWGWQRQPLAPRRQGSRGVREEWWV